MQLLISLSVLEMIKPWKLLPALKEELVNRVNIRKMLVGIGLAKGKDHDRKSFRCSYILLSESDHHIPYNLKGDKEILITIMVANDRV